MEFLSLIWDAITGPLFPPTIALFYLVLKTFIRFTIRKHYNLDFDFWDVVAWFSIDISVLCLALSLGLRLHDILKFNPNKTIIYYVGITLVIIIGGFLYGHFTKKRTKLQMINPLKSFTLSGTLFILYFPSGTFFIGILRTLIDQQVN